MNDEVGYLVDAFNDMLAEVVGITEATLEDHEAELSADPMRVEGAAVRRD